MDVEEFEDDAIDICASNVKYPTHFTVSSKDFRAVEIPDEEINEWIQEGIQYFRENPEEYSFLWVLVIVWYIYTNLMKIKNIML